MASKPTKRVVAALGCAMAAACVSAAPARAQTPECGSGQPHVAVIVEGLRSAKGQITVTLYPDDPARFMAKGGKLARVRVPAARGAVCVPIDAPGAYAATVYHDEDGDGRFDRNPLGLPTEGFGVSNNPSFTLAMPRLEQARFRAGEGETVIHIRVRYLLGGRLR